MGKKMYFNLIIYQNITITGYVTDRQINVDLSNLCVSFKPSSSSYLVDSIRPILCLQTEGAVLLVPCPPLSCHGAIQEVGSVELDSWLARRDLQDTPTGWVAHSEMKEKSFPDRLD